MQIEILSGSHTSIPSHNHEAYDDVSELLLSDENPYKDIFQEETLFLDSTDGYIGIEYHTYIDLDDYMDYKELTEFVNWLREKVKVDSIYVGDFVFNK